ncbi:g661 [Coccomyxa viridis]|uniref:G661 protein n=1 Tax=Coccomyxa viridis TaxID=1274662 RepID=A0ABP1FG95_9CHLO
MQFVIALLLSIFERHALDALEDGAAGTFGIDARADQSHGIQNLKEKVSETLRVFQQTGVLHEREYDERVSPSVHGAPRNAEEGKEVLGRLQRMDNFESQDFDAMENDIERAANLNRDHLDYLVEESWRWAFAFFIGLAMGLCAFLVDISLETLNNWKFGAVDSVIRSRGGFWRPYLAFIGICLLYSGISGALVSFGSPLAAGSGIPEIKTYLNGVHVKGELSPSLESPALQSCFCSDYAPLEFMRIVRNHTSHGRALLKHL